MVAGALDRDYLGRGGGRHGEFWIKCREAGRKYRVEVGKDGYEDAVRIVTTDGDQDLGVVALKRRG
jgi:hypothetical protein